MPNPYLPRQTVLTGIPESLSFRVEIAGKAMIQFANGNLSAPTSALIARSEDHISNLKENIEKFIEENPWYEADTMGTAECADLPYPFWAVALSHLWERVWDYNEDALRTSNGYTADFGTFWTAFQECAALDNFSAFDSVLDVFVAKEAEEWRAYLAEEAADAVRDAQESLDDRP